MGDNPAYDDEGRCVKCGHDFNDDSRNDHARPACPECQEVRPLAECKKAHQGDCEGDVEWRMNPHTWKSWGAMCGKHYEGRLGLEDDTNRRYGIHSDVAPEGFDESYAGERWEDD